jgi:hypothetical protein
MHPNDEFSTNNSPLEPWPFNIQPVKSTLVSSSHSNLVKLRSMAWYQSIGTSYFFALEKYDMPID